MSTIVFQTTKRHGFVFVHANYSYQNLQNPISTGCSLTCNDYAFTLAYFCDITLYALVISRFLLSKLYAMDVSIFF